MKTNLDTNYNELATFVLLDDTDFTNEVLSKITPEQPNLELTVLVNGVELSAEVFKKTINKFLNNIDQEFQEKYSDLDKLAEEKARKIIEEKADEVLDKLHHLSSFIDSVKDVI